MTSKEALRTIERYVEYNCDREFEIVFKDLDKYMQLKKIVTDFITWLDSESTRDWYQYGDIYEHLVYKVDEVLG